MVFYFHCSLEYRKRKHCLYFVCFCCVLNIHMQVLITYLYIQTRHSTCTKPGHKYRIKKTNTEADKKNEEPEKKKYTLYRKLVFNLLDQEMDSYFQSNYSYVMDEELCYCKMMNLTNQLYHHLYYISLEYH